MPLNSSMGSQSLQLCGSPCVYFNLIFIMTYKNINIYENSTTMPLILIIILQFTLHISAFEFKSPTVSSSVLTINTQTTFQITLFRQFTSTGAPTNYNSEIVSASANVTITFPTEYTLSGTQSCQFIIFSGVPSTTFGCTIDTGNNQIIFTNSLTADTYVDMVQIQISSVLNPSPAVTTSPFMAEIGTDISAYDDADSSTSIINLEEAALTNLQVTFNPTVVNTTSSMIVTLVNTNIIPVDGSIRVTFPSNLYWERDVAAENHSIPLDSVSSCSALTNIYFQITCSGSSTTKEVTITNAFDSEIAAGTTLSFSINNLFSPPTTQSIDSITVTTYYSSDSTQPIDSSSSLITGLTAQTMNLNLGSTTTATVNTYIGLSFQITLTDTVTYEDTFEVRFPSGTTINQQTQFSFSFGLASNTTYDSSTFLLTFYQKTISPTRYATYVGNITFLSYLTPSSTKTTGDIEFAVLRNGYQKMTGVDTITAVGRPYSMTSSTSNTQINSQTSYDLVLDMQDAITSSGYIQITIPSELTLSPSFTVSIAGDSTIVSAPTAQQSSGKIILTSLNASSADIAAQTFTITIDGLTQPSSVQDISGFSTDVFYSSEGDMVGTGTSTNSITLTPGQIQSPSVTSSSFVTADTSVQYTYSYTSANTLQAGGTIEVNVPTNDVGLASGGTCTVQGSSASCSVSGDKLIYTVGSEIAGQTDVTLTYSSMENPHTTKESQNFTISTYNSASQLIDTVGSTPMTITMTVPSNLPSTLTRSSNKNNDETTYTLSFSQPQPLQNSAKAIITLPPQTTLGAYQCFNENSLQLNCSNSGNVITVELQSVQQQDYDYEITVTNIKNPQSLEPTSSITIETITSDELYSYSSISSGLQITNTIPSDFQQLNYTFSNSYLAENSILSISLEEEASPDYYVIELAPSFTVGTILCFSDDFSPICSVSSYTVTVSSGLTIPTSFTLNISGITNPPSLPVDYTEVRSFTSTNYLISENKNTVIFTTACTFPCKECTSTLSECTLCYPSSLTTKIYLFESQCLSTCPSGYYENTLDLRCSQCLVPCAQCEDESNYCTYCDTNSSYIYLNRTNTTSTCLSACPTFMYADTTQIPNLCVDCVTPCSKCSELTVCESCVVGYFLYGSDCLVSCPADVTVQINQQCVDCSTQCATCAVTITNCTSCSSVAALYNGSCVLDCPGNLIIKDSSCVECEDKCNTCEVEIFNCTSCDSSSSFPYFYDFDCLATCPSFFYPDSFNECLACADLNRGCTNCSSPSVCLSCDSGYVLLNNNCLDNTPDGYLNISGVAQACQGDCETCSATLTNCTSCKTLNLFGNTCLATCPTGTTAINQLCQYCQSPCEECSGQVTTCLSCEANSSTYLFSSSCVAAEDCPTTTYGNPVTLQCDSCISPCLACNSSSECLTCVSSYFYYEQNLQCLTTCPSGMVGVDKDCVNCSSPCQECQTTRTRCTSCIASYFFNSNTNQCLSECPSGLIENLILMECVSCTSPCKTCQNTTDTCLSCVSGTFLSNTECSSTCPEGYYGSSGLCVECENNCTTCSSKSTCLTCSYPFAYYSGQCLEDCPVTHAIVSNTSVCISCETVMVGCSNCSQNGECYECFSPKIYFNTQCLDECPDGYEYTDFTCKIPTNTTEPPVDPRLTNQSIFPLPFTILGCVLFLACCVSKIQNSNTYLIGVAYALFGFIQTACIAYLLVRYYLLGSQIYELNMVYMLLGVLGGIYLLNLFSFLVQSPLLCIDELFASWLQTYCSNRTFFAFMTIFSFLVNYKLKMVLFTKLFSFICMRAILESVQKFRMFNIFSFFGLLPQALCLYVCFISIFNFITGTQIFMWFLDAIIIVIINMILAILVAWKKDDFFAQADEDGFYFNKKFIADGQDISKQALDGHYYEDNFINKDTYNPIEKGAGIIEESDDLSVSLSNNEEFSHTTQIKEKDEIIQEEKVRTKEKSKIKAYFEKQSSSHLIRNKNDDKFSKTKAENIFESSSVSDQKNKTEYEKEESFISDVGRSQKVLISQMKTSKAVIVTGENIKSNKATASQDIRKKITEREHELDELKQEMNEKDKVRKEYQKNQRLMRKSIEAPSTPEERSVVDDKEEKSVQVEEQQEKNEEKSVQVTQKQEEEKVEQSVQVSEKSKSIKVSDQESLSIKEFSMKQSSLSMRDREFQQQKNTAAKILNLEKPHDSLDLNEEEPKNQGWLEMRINEDLSDLPVFTTMHGGRENETYKQGTEQQSMEDAQKRKESRRKTIEERRELKVEQKSKTINIHEKQQYQENNGRERLNSQENSFENENRSEERISEKEKQHDEFIQQEKQEVKDQELERQNEQKSLGEKSHKNLQQPRKYTLENQQSLTISLEKSGDEESLRGYYQYASTDKPITQTYKTKTKINTFIENQQKQLIMRDKTEENQKKSFDFQEENQNYDDRDNTRQNYYNLQLEENHERQQSGLQDSQNESEDINSKPMQPIKKKGMNNHEALIEVLQKSQKEKVRKYNPTSIQSERKFVRKRQTEESSDKSRVYQAGLRQFARKNQTDESSDIGRNHISEVRKLGKNLPKKSQNYLNKKHLGKNQVQEDGGDEGITINSKNKSFNHPFNKIFPSKDLSKESDGLDDLEFQSIPKPHYLELLNERQKSIGRDEIARKPGTSASSRKNYRKRNSKGKLSVEKMKLKNKSVQDEDDDLREYYKKDDSREKSLEKKQSRQKIGSREKNRRKSSKEQIFEKKRIRHLQRIYLPNKS